MTVIVPAKVNLFLRVVQRREDGYHELETVMQSVSLIDELSFAPAAELRLSCNWPDLPLGSENLVWKAAAALHAHCSLPPDRSAAIDIHKRIPAGAGLGGGSADAAAALVGCARLWELALRQEELMALAARLGSDVPFFLAGGAAVARGRGEHLQGLPDPPELWMVLVKPPLAVSTAWAYRAWAPGASSGPALIRFLDAFRSGSPSAIAAALRNDLEPGVARVHPEIGALRRRLVELGALGAGMTGSGSAVFGIAGEEAGARRIAAALGEGWGETFVVRALAASPPGAVQEGQNRPERSPR